MSQDETLFGAIIKFLDSRALKVAALLSIALGGGYILIPGVIYVVTDLAGVRDACR